MKHGTICKCGMARIYHEHPTQEPLALRDGSCPYYRPRYPKVDVPPLTYRKSDGLGVYEVEKRFGNWNVIAYALHQAHPQGLDVLAALAETLDLLDQRTEQLRDALAQIQEMQSANKTATPASISYRIKKSGRPH